MYLDPLFYQCYEGIEDDKFVIATYAMAVPREGEALRYAESISVEQTTGTWTSVPGDTSEVRERHLGRLIGLYEVPAYPLGAPEGVGQRYYIARFAFPIINFEDKFSTLLTTVFGNISTIDNVKLMDLEFPQSYLDQFQGPKFGIEGIRETLGVYDRPLINNMIKPCIGLNPQQTAELAYQAAVGGTDIIKDDELTADPINCRLMDRVKAVVPMIQKADEEKGEKTLYCFNITDRTEKLRENALRAIENGANAIMVNTWTMGLDSCRMLAEDPEINVPILSHPDLLGALHIPKMNGMATKLVYSKLIRLAGLDMFIMPAPYGKFPIAWDTYMELIYSARMPMGNIKPMMPMPGGGGHPGLVEEMMNTLGDDFVLAAGGGITGHPDGPMAGAKAYRQAIEVVKNGASLTEVNESTPELYKALQKWGVYGAEQGKGLYAIK